MGLLGLSRVRWRRSVQRKLWGRVGNLELCIVLGWHRWGMEDWTWEMSICLIS